MRARTIGRALALAALAAAVLTSCAAEDTNGDTSPATGDDNDATVSAEPAPSGVSGEPDEIDDVSIAECTTDAAGMVARLAVLNDSSKRSTYTVDVTFEDAAGSQLATGFVFVNNLEPGQATQSDAHSLTEAPGPFTCRLVSVDRSASV
jgi:hypothetical protein